MISGALSLTEKSVLEVMTNLEDVFAVPIEASLDFETMSDIVKRGYTRIPIYEGKSTESSRSIWSICYLPRFLHLFDQLICLLVTICHILQLWFGWH